MRHDVDGRHHVSFIPQGAARQGSHERLTWPFTVEQALMCPLAAELRSDVGGMFANGARLSDVPLKWMAQAAASAGLLLDTAALQAAQQQVTPDCATGAIHTNSPIWLLAGGRRLRKVPKTGAVVHASVALRLEAHQDYARRLPPAGQYTITDEPWLDSILPQPSTPAASTC